jgi:transcriptional regulator with XRE-family HTH domain
MTPDQYKATRKAIGLKQHELAERLGVTRETVCNRERGTSTISKEAAMAIKHLRSRSNNAVTGVIVSHSGILNNTEPTQTITVTASHDWPFSLVGRLVEINPNPDIESQQTSSNED